MRMFYTIAFVTLACVACFGQTSYKGLTPGRSTRADVERVLGQPVKVHSGTLVEYSPQSLTGRIFVQYGTGSAAVERFEFLCRSQASTCDDLTRSLRLSISGIPLAESHTADASGKFVRYYGDYVAATIDNQSEGSVYSLVPARIAFYSRELFAAAVAKAAEENAKDLDQLTVFSLRFFEGGFDTQPLEQRQYRTRFPREGTRYVKYEITVSSPKSRLGSPISITSMWFRDEATQPFKTFVLENKLDDYSAVKIFSEGLGRADGHGFSQRPGKYTMEIHIDGRKVAVGSFEIY